jgi:hypothetical protein
MTPQEQNQEQNQEQSQEQNQEQNQEQRQEQNQEQSQEQNQEQNRTQGQRQRNSLGWREIVENGIAGKEYNGQGRRIPFEQKLPCRGRAHRDRLKTGLRSRERFFSS